MSTQRLNILEQFILLFNALKKAAKDDPEKLEIFYGQNAHLKNVANNLYNFMGYGDFERRIFHSNKKYIQHAPDGFDEAWKEYKKKWSGPLQDCQFKIDFSEIFPEMKDYSEIGSSKPQIEIELDPPDLELDTEFDPIHHDGGMAFEMAFYAADSYAENVDTEFEDTIHIESKIGLDAYDYLTNTIGFNASEVFRRWRQIPVIFMPAHVSNKHGLTERGSIYELIDDAVRAYVFGAPAAAIAMCRAILEMILKQHYDLDYRYRDSKGKLRDKGLGGLIILADERYGRSQNNKNGFFDGQRVRKLSDAANKIMHDYSSRETISKEDERIILNFFKTNKFLIERAPRK